MARGRSGRGKALGLVAGAAALGIGAGVAAERLLVGRRRLRDDPYVEEPYGMVKGDRTFKVKAPDGATIHVEEVGAEGATQGAIFLHGYCLDRTIWHHQILDLSGSSQRRHLFYDAREHGLSRGGNSDLTVQTMARDLKAVIDSAGLNEIVLVGHSMGGMTVLEFCREFEDEIGARVKGLVLVNTTYTDALKTFIAGEVVGPIERRMRKLINMVLNDQRSVRALRLRGDDLSYLIVKLFGFGKDASPAQVEFVRRLNSVFPNPPLLETLRGLRDFDMSDALEVIDVPTLIIAGGTDRLTTVKASQHMADKIPGARLVIFEDVGHSSMLERWHEFNDLVEDFLDVNLPAATKGKRNKASR